MGAVTMPLPQRSRKAFENDDGVPLEELLKQGEIERRKYARDEQNRRENKIRADEDNYVNASIGIDGDALQLEEYV
jgi:hypothetical protein